MIKNKKIHIEKSELIETKHENILDYYQFDLNVSQNANSVNWQRSIWSGLQGKTKAGKWRMESCQKIS